MVENPSRVPSTVGTAVMGCDGTSVLLTSSPKFDGYQPPTSRTDGVAYLFTTQAVLVVARSATRSPSCRKARWLRGAPLIGLSGSPSIPFRGPMANRVLGPPNKPSGVPSRWRGSPPRQPQPSGTQLTASAAVHRPR